MLIWKTLKTILKSLIWYNLKKIHDPAIKYKNRQPKINFFTVIIKKHQKKIKQVRYFNSIEVSFDYSHRQANWFEGLFSIIILLVTHDRNHRNTTNNQCIKVWRFNAGNRTMTCRYYYTCLGNFKNGNSVLPFIDILSHYASVHIYNSYS